MWFFSVGQEHYQVTLWQDQATVAREQWQRIADENGTGSGSKSAAFLLRHWCEDPEVIGLLRARAPLEWKAQQQQMLLWEDALFAQLLVRSLEKGDLLLWQLKRPHGRPVREARLLDGITTPGDVADLWQNWKDREVERLDAWAATHGIAAKAAADVAKAAIDEVDGDVDALRFGQGIASGTLLGMAQDAGRAGQAVLLLAGAAGAMAKAGVGGLLATQKAVRGLKATKKAARVEAATAKAARVRAATEAGTAAQGVTKTLKTAEPVSYATGEELLEEQDFSLPGGGVVWQRTYRSGNSAYCSALGWGWALSVDQTLRIDRERQVALYRDQEGLRWEIELPKEPGQTVQHGAERWWLTRHEQVADLSYPGSHTVVAFELIKGDPGPLQQRLWFAPVGTIEQALGQALRLVKVQTQRHDTQFFYRPVAAPRVHTMALAEVVVRRRTPATSDGGNSGIAAEQRLVVQSSPTGLVEAVYWVGSPSAPLEWSPADAADVLEVEAEELAGDAWVLAPETGAAARRLPDVRFKAPAGGLGGTAEAVKAGYLRICLVSYEYDAAGCLVRIRDRSGTGESYVYGGAPTSAAASGGALLKQRTLRSGYRFFFAWAGSGPLARCVRTWGEDGAYDTRLTYAVEERRTQATDAFGIETFYYNENNLITRHVDRTGAEWLYEYDAAGRCVRAQNPLGGVTQYHYNGAGVLESITQPDGTQRRFAYGAGLELEAMRDATGALWQWQYDGEKRLVASVDPAGGERRWAYGASGELTCVRDARGGEWHYRWNDAGQVTEVAGPTGEVTRYRYNGLGEVVEIAASDGAVQRLTRDRAGRVVEVQGPGATQLRLTYDESGQLTALTDGLGRTTRYRYSRLGAVVEREAADGTRSLFEYDSFGRQTALVNAKGERHTLRRDAQGRLLEERGFDGRLQRFAYDAGGRLTTHWDGVQLGMDGGPAGALRQLTYTYDACGRVVGVSAGDGGWKRFGYDAEGRLVEAINPAATVRLQRDAAGRIVEEQQDAGVLRHRLDAAGRRLETALDAELQVGVRSDAAGRWTAVEVAHGEDGGRPVRVEQQRGVTGRVVQRRQGVVETQQRFTPEGLLAAQRVWLGSAADAGALPAAGRELVLGAAPGEPVALGERLYGYDGAGQLVHFASNLGGGSDAFAAHYKLDPLGQIREALGALPERFELDACGNLVWQQEGGERPAGVEAEVESGEAGEGGGAAVEVYRTSRGNRLRRLGSAHYRYDACGSLVERRRAGSGERESFVYDGFGQLCAYTRGSGPRQTYATYRYDALGRRIAKSVADGQRGEEVTTQFLWNGDVLARERSERRAVGGAALEAAGRGGDAAGASSTASTTWYVFEPESFVPLCAVHEQGGGFGGGAVRGAGIGTGVGTGGGGSAGEGARHVAAASENGLEERGRRRVYHFHTDAVGLPRDVFDEAGRVVWHGTYGALGGLVAESGTGEFQNLLRFQGQYADSESGLHYNRHRYYDFEGGRYVGQDPIGLAGGLLNLYQYAPTNPWESVDPLGLCGAPKVGDKVYRVWGKDPTNPDIAAQQSGPWGRSWTRTDPSTVPDYRNSAGLPDAANKGRFVSEGRITDLQEVTTRDALPLGQNVGGGDEVLFPNPESQISLERVSGSNPEF